MGSWAGSIAAITLFAEDLAATKAFYAEVFELPLVHEDETSAAFRLGDTIVNVLTVSSAPELIDPAAVAPPESGSRCQLTVGVDDVDAMCATLQERGVTLVNGPVDRPWGIRTACFRDPAGHLWEIAT